MEICIKNKYEKVIFLYLLFRCTFMCPVITFIAIPVYPHTHTHTLMTRHIHGHALYHNACIISTNFLMMGLHGSKHVGDTL